MASSTVQSVSQSVSRAVGRLAHAPSQSVSRSASPRSVSQSATTTKRCCSSKHTKKDLADSLSSCHPCDSCKFRMVGRTENLKNNKKNTKTNNNLDTGLRGCGASGRKVFGIWEESPALGIYDVDRN